METTYFILDNHRIAWRILVRSSLFEPWLTLLIGPSSLHLPIPFPNFDSPIFLKYTISLEIFISSWSITVRHSFSTKADTPITYLLISSLIFGNKDEAYLDNRVNFKEYSYTHATLPNVDKFLHLNFLLLKRKEPIKECFYKHVPICGTRYYQLLLFHWVNQTWATSFNW